ncbi:MAG TPA: exodeoxyribonuclease VII large subunit [Bacillota bacterium]|nr:exodeoxyribonuclease VII large subunit [Bacillota bacterium]HPF42410.1 exodeoxyribonuclease VII large subunit [Bacillota bacterium]HPQ61327.1 exodeoxyribonuclease VII large subunit [Bacillota bacterium]
MEKKYITVSALNRYLKYFFDNDKNLQNILLKAEISNFKRHSRGHLYFTLKDDSSQIPAVMFQSNAVSLDFEPKDGSKVVVEGYVSVYEPIGNYQVYVRKMYESGIGDLYQAYENLKKKLSEAGMFDESHKRPLPQYPKNIGVITSPTGAAVRDIIHIVNRRYPLARIIVYPTLVQGDEAKYSIVRMIEKANKDLLSDVLIVGRGGGSIEDLWAFNEEIVAKAIYESKIPVISAVGHETDFTIADFVSDRRAPTPSGAAEIVVPDQNTLLMQISGYTRNMAVSWQKYIQVKTDMLNTLRRSPVILNGERLLEKPELKLASAYDRLLQKRPDRILDSYREKTNNLKTRISLVLENLRLALETRVENDIDRLELVNPLSLMKKGYAMARKNGTIVKTVSLLEKGDNIELQMSDGIVGCTVDRIGKD